jgi:hypothetical protein
MLDGERQIPCAVSTSAMDELENRRRQSPICEKRNSSGCAIGSKSVPLARFLQWSSKALRPVSFCVAWIFERAHSCVAGLAQVYCRAKPLNLPAMSAG